MDAASKHSWEAGLLALIVVSGFAAFGWTLKVIMQRHLAVEERTLNDARDREIRLAGRVTTLEDLVRGELLALIRTNSETMGKVLSAADSICRASHRMVQTLDRFTSVLDVRPCLLSTAEASQVDQKAGRSGKQAQRDGVGAADDEPHSRRPIIAANP